MSSTGAGAAAKGAALQTYNNELVKCLEELGSRKSVLDAEISVDEKEKKMIETQIRQLQNQLSTVDDRLKRKYEAREQYEKTLNESESAYKKILETSPSFIKFRQKRKPKL